MLCSGSSLLHRVQLSCCAYAGQGGRRAKQSHQGDHRQNAHGATFALAGAGVAQACQDAAHIGKAGADAGYGVVGLNFVLEIDEAFVADCG